MNIPFNIWQALKKSLWVALPVFGAALAVEIEGWETVWVWAPLIAGLVRYAADWIKHGASAQ